MPRDSDVVESCFSSRHGGELVELLAQRHHQPGVRKLSTNDTNAPFWENIGPTVWTKFAHSVTERCPREGTTLYRAAKAVETSLRPAIHVRTSSTKRGRTMNCATSSTRSKRSGPILGFGSSFAGFTSSRKERSSGLGGTETEPASRIGKSALLESLFRPHSSKHRVGVS